MPGPQKRPPPKGEYSRFRKLLGRLVRIPKSEIDEKEREYQDQRERLRKKAR